MAIIGLHIDIFTIVKAEIMRIAEINMMHIGSTGKIMFSIADCARTIGHEVKTFSSAYYHKKTAIVFNDVDEHTYFGMRLENYMHVRFAQLTGFHGCFSGIGTYALLHVLDQYQPDILHLHNLHNWSINIPMLFRYIKKHRIKTIWTLHDCWAFTGHCPHFLVAGCEKWKNGCHHCTQIREYPKAFVDNTKAMYQLKKRWFTGIDNMVLVTPSKWLAGLVKESFLKDYPVQVINNGIDLSVFIPKQSSFREQYRIPAKKHIVLGVAFGWGYRKGLDVFQELADTLDASYQIVLVGTDEKTDRTLPENIISIHRTSSQSELAGIYSTADVFVNPTREDNFPTVNIEALACGTPVITFDTGGSPEIIDETCGMVVPCDDVDALRNAVIHVIEEKPFFYEACIERAKRYDMRARFEEYVQLYERIAAQNKK